MGDRDYLRLGDWNARCMRCNKKYKGTELQITWDQLWVCRRCWEPRQPQDFVRGIVEHPTPPFVYNPADTFIFELCSPNAMTAIVDFAVCDCVVVDYISPSFDPTVTSDF